VVASESGKESRFAVYAEGNGMRQWCPDVAGSREGRRPGEDGKIRYIFCEVGNHPAPMVW
jgi:hypothetical protein